MLCADEMKNVANSMGMMCQIKCFSGNCNDLKGNMIYVINNVICIVEKVLFTKILVVVVDFLKGQTLF